MTELPGYELQQELYDNGIVGIFRARNKVTHESVIIKMLLSEYPQPEDIARIKHEYKLIDSIKTSGIVKIIKLEKYQNQYALILEDSKGITLKEYLRTHTLSLEQFLNFAIQLAKIIGEIHEAGIIHKDINPENILVIKDSEVKVIDFSIASQLLKEEQAIKNIDVLEGSLPYISPEQTGRTNRSIDERTDFYSLGITFYEMLTGQLPYTADDPIEWVHNHIAKQAVPPIKIKATIPEVVSDLTMKLLAKQAEDRYLSSTGLMYDLEKCLREYNTTGTIEKFELGTRDTLSQFQIPEKLYGREEQVALLLDSYERAAEGAVELVTVMGQPGIGKSRLVNEIQKSIVEKRSFYIEGKFDLQQQDIPYNGIIQAFRKLVKQILTKNDLQVEHWKKEILNTVGINAGILVEVVPELEALIGKQTALPIENIAESQTRLGLVMIDLLKLFAKPEHPLVIFLDDMQWVDVATVSFLVNILRDPEMHYLMLILAYRETKSGLNVLTTVVEKVKKYGIAAVNIQLGPLTLENINRMLEDILKTHDVELLAEVIHSKTAGNPFFINSLLAYLYREKIIKFNSTINKWQWDLNEIQMIGISDNVVDLVQENIARLPKESQELLMAAACIGAEFNLELLAKIVAKSTNYVANHLWPAMQEQMIIPISDKYKLAMIDEQYSKENQNISYRFSHDRVQQAAYQILNDQEKARTHLKIGRILLEMLSKSDVQNKIFDVVFHFNLASTLIKDKKEKHELVVLNNLAGKRAKESATFEIALNYYKQAETFLPNNCWEVYYDDTFEAKLGQASCASLSGKFDEADKAFDDLLSQDLTIFYRAKTLATKAEFLGIKSEYDESIKTNLKALEMLGITNIDANPSFLKIGIELIKSFKKMKTLDVSKLDNLEEEKLPDKKLIISIFKNLNLISYLSKPKLLIYLTLKSVQIIDQVGDYAARATSLNGFAVMEQLILDRYQDAARLSKVAMKLADKSSSLSVRAQCYFVDYVVILPWTKSLRACQEALLDVLHYAKQSGNLFVLAHTVGAITYMEIFSGVPLNEVLKTLHKNFGLIEMSNNIFNKDSLRLVQKCIAFLSDSYEKSRFEHISAEMMRLMNVPVDFILPRAFTLLYVAYVMDEREVGFELIDKYKWLSLRPKSVITFINFYYYFVMSLIIIKNYHKMTLRQKIIYLSFQKFILRKFKSWNNLNPQTFSAFYEALICGKYLLSNKLDKAMEHYEISISLARENGFVNVEAFINDLMAWYFQSKGQPRNMRSYLLDARYAYQQLGMKAKVEQLLKEYPDVFAKRSPAAPLDMSASIKLSPNISLTSTTAPSGMLDLATVMKSSQAISSQVNFEELIKTLVKILTENAGAQRGVLILKDNVNLIVKADFDAQANQFYPIKAESIEKYEKISSNIIRFVYRTKEPVLLGDAIRAAEFADDAYIVKYKPVSILCLPIINQGNVVAILYLENNLTRDAFTSQRFEVLRMLSGQAAISLENARLYSAYDQFVPHEFLDLLNKRSIIDVRLGDHVRKNMTVLFSDIRNFTLLSEKIGPDETFKFMNEYLGLMEPIIKKHNGFIDKYIGDAVMALFSGNASDAVAAAVDMQITLNKFNEDRAQKGLATIRIGIGINSGNLMLGTLGGEKRLQTSVISDVVNVAARLEELTKEYDSYILISEAVHQNLADPSQFQSRYAFSALIRGKSQKVTVWEVFAGDPPEKREKKSLIAEDYAQAASHYNLGRYQEALDLFKKCLAILPEDKILQLYIIQCNKYLKG